MLLSNFKYLIYDITFVDYQNLSTSATISRNLRDNFIVYRILRSSVLLHHFTLAHLIYCIHNASIAVNGPIMSNNIIIDLIECEQFHNIVFAIY